MRAIGYLAIDQGPRQTLQALAAQLPGRWLEAPRDLRDVQLLICGTSDTAEGRKAETEARKVAHENGVPCVVVEDFPGNFNLEDGGAPSALIVESAASERLARRKLGAASTKVELCPSIRYDPLRRKLVELRDRAGPDTNAVLWIGQPETDDCLATLRPLMPALAAHDVILWFRAHPRDRGYRERAYHDVLWDTGVYVEDMTSMDLEECLSHHPRLLITQFSSVGIEAGFWGIPTLNLLLPDAGGSRLLAKKGYAVPPWCEEGAAFLETREERFLETLERALTSSEARVSVQARFDRYFRVREEGIPSLIKLLYNQGFLSGPR